MIAPQQYAQSYGNNFQAMSSMNCMPSDMAFGRGMGLHPVNQASFVQQNYRGFQNFLQNSPYVARNLVPNADGIVETTFDSSKYSQLLIISCDDNSVTQNMVDIDLTQEKVDKRDLSLNNPLNPEKFYNEVRNAIKQYKGQKYLIEDLTAVELMIVDSLEKVKRVQDEVCKIHGAGSLGQANDLAFLLKWNTLDDEEKHKKYSKFSCHEVNLFIFFKDQTYFNSVVKPFLENKMQKDFIDHWLLGNAQVCDSYKELPKFVGLNALEKCLLVQILVKTDKPAAQRITERILNEAESSEVHIDIRNRLFDTVLNLNILHKEEKPSDGPVRRIYRQRIYANSYECLAICLNEQASPILKQSKH